MPTLGEIKKGVEMNSEEFFSALTEFKKGYSEPIHETTAVLSYEVGRMMEQAMYMHWNKGDGQEYRTRLGFFKSELMDAIAQCDLLCGSLGIELNEMRELGQEKALERFTGREKK